jgi:hypothetical protein
MTRDGTVGRSDATERSLPFHWDIDPARMMRPRFADSIRASSPSGLREQAGHMTASDFWTPVPYDKINNLVAPDGGAHVCAPRQAGPNKGVLFCVILPSEG